MENTHTAVTYSIKYGNYENFKTMAFCVGKHLMWWRNFDVCLSLCEQNGHMRPPDR